jgi:hypothetical protein
MIQASFLLRLAYRKFTLNFYVFYIYKYCPRFSSFHSVIIIIIIVVVVVIIIGIIIIIIIIIIICSLSRLLFSAVFY